MRTLYLYRHSVTSQYGLLGRMTEELGEAFGAQGWRVASAEEADGDVASGRAGPGSLLLWPNFLKSAEALPASVREGRLAGVQFFVDHPYALGDGMMRSMGALAGGRGRIGLALVSADGMHLASMRWPGLSVAHVPHGVSRSALADPDWIERSQRGGGERTIDVVLAGTILTEAELAERRGRLPEGVASAAEQAVGLLCAEPWTPMEQALDLCLGTRGLDTGHWGVSCAAASYVVGKVNRLRRIAWVRALDGLRVMVFGRSNWREVCGGTVAYGGEVSYAESAGLMRRAKVCLALGPTQFTHGFSERLLLSMAGGAAAVADDRLMVRAHFGSVGEDGQPAAGGRAAVEMFDARSAESVRAAVERALGDEERRVSMTALARRTVEARHLWTHRVGALAQLAERAMAREGASEGSAAA